MNYIYQNDYKSPQQVAPAQSNYNNVLQNGRSISPMQPYNMKGYSQYPQQQQQQQQQQQPSPATQTYTYHHPSPSSNMKDVVGTGVQQQAPHSTYYQPLSYATQTGRTVQRTASPMILQQPRYTSSQNHTPINTNKYLGPSYQAEIIQQAQQATSSASSGNKDQPSTSYLPNPYTHNLNTYSRPYNNAPAPAAAATTRPSYLPSSGANNGTSNSTYSATTAATDLSQNEGGFSSHYSKYTGSSHQLRQYSNNNNNNATSNNINATNNNNNENMGLRYQPGATSGQSSSNSANTLQPSQPYQRNPYHGRTMSMQKPADYYEELNNQRNSRPSSSNGTYNASMSPSKRVTFNLSRNTYTNIEQIEKRLNESTRLRLVEDHEDDQPPVTIPIIHDSDSLDITSSNSIERRANATNDYYRVGRERERDAIAFGPQSPSRQSQTEPGCTTPRRDNSQSGGTRTQKLVRNPSRSKSPIKPSLKRNSSYSSPMKGGGAPQSNYSAGNNNNNILQTRSDKANESPLSNQTNKMMNVNSSKEVPRSTTPTAKYSNGSTGASSNNTISDFSVGVSAAKENQLNGQAQQSNDASKPSSAEIKGKKGILKYSDGSRYDGEILNNQRHGFGTLMSSEFSVIYQGTWANDTYHGQGKFFNPLSENLQEDYNYKDFDIALSQFWESYEGEFFEGKLDGFGTLMLTNGEKLVGNFKKGRISGKGTYYCTQGPAVTAKWEDNRLVEKY